MKNRKFTKRSREMLEHLREDRLRRRALDTSSGKAPPFEEDDSFEEAFERDADDLALADTVRSEALRTFGG
jgi:hypothetical protein